MVTPPKTPSGLRARRRAESRGWAPSLAWDEDVIDDPSASPCVTEAPKSKHADWLDSYDELIGTGVAPQVAAERLGLSWKTVYSTLHRRDKRAA